MQTEPSLTVVTSAGYPPTSRPVLSSPRLLPSLFAQRRSACLAGARHPLLLPPKLPTRRLPSCEQVADAPVRPALCQPHLDEHIDVAWTWPHRTLAGWASSARGGAGAHGGP